MKKNTLKKLLAIVLVFAMLAPIMGHLGTNAGEVQAEEETESVGYVIVPSSAVTITEPTDTTQPKVMSVKTDDETYGQYANYIFAGWYTDEAATTAAASGTTGAYARFVPVDVLSTKVQVTNGIVTNTANEAYQDKYVMRFVSSVDSTDYKYAGFELSYEDEETNETVTLESKTYKVFKRIDSTTGATDNDVDTYEFSPKVVDTKSEYFITGKWPVAEQDKAVNYTVKAYWMTKDGTKVYGRERCVSVEDGLGTTGLNLTVDGDLTGSAYTAFYNNWDGAQVSNLNVEILTTGNGYSNVRIKEATRDTKSVTTVSITDGTNTFTAEYRNLYSKYEDENGKTKADGSWYSSDEDEYIIATRADLYGLTVLCDADNQFSGKKVYLVSDIAANPEKLEMLEGDNYLKWYTYDEENQKVYTNSASYNWKPIGYTKYPFAGTFDGQGHTISGIYLDNTDRYDGLFAATDNSATIKDVKLKNSYIKTTQYDIGSIVGVAKGTLDTVYSDAIVECNGARSGGMVGQAAGTDFVMKNCWYAGKITNSANATDKRGTGGLVGAVTNGAKLTMTNCLNTGTVDVSTFTVQPYAGGLVGQVGQGASGILVLEDSLSTGEIKHVASVTAGYGVVGYVSTGSNSTMTKTYGIKSACNRAITAGSNVTLSNKISVIDADIKGTAAQTAMTNLGWGTTWTTVAHGIPVLSVFEKEVYDTSWYDEDKSVYVLKDKGDLYGFAKLSATNNFADKTVKLAGDIIVNTGDADDWAAGTKVPYYTWTPIGSNGIDTSSRYIRTSFAGVFDGDMHTISGIYHVAAARFGGLFSETSTSSTIQNLKLTNSYFNSTYADFGSISGCGIGTYQNVYSDAIVNVSGDRSGGLTGQYAGTKGMTNCWYAGQFTDSGKKQQHGGLIGYAATEFTITDCLNTGTIKSAYTGPANRMGGLIGFVDTNGKVTVTRCLNVGLVQQSSSATGQYGPIVGYSKGTTNITTDSYVAKESASLHTSSNLTGSYTQVVEADMLGVKASTNASGLGFYSEETPDGAWVTVDYRTPVLKVFKNESDGRIDVSWFDANAYADASEYILYDEADLYGFAMLSKDYNFDSKTVKLGADIIVNEGTASSAWATKSNYRQWSPIGLYSSATPYYTDFLGTFDGQGHAISGLYLNTTWRFVGLFASVGSSGVVQNLSLKNSYFNSSGREFGGIAGYGAGKFCNIYNEVIMDAKHRTVGGFIGQAAGAVVLDHCWYNGTLTNKDNNSAQNGTGGLIGIALGTNTITLTNCLNSGSVAKPNYNMQESDSNIIPCLGGLIGRVETPIVINACVNRGTVSKDNATKGYGPLVGWCKTKDLVSISATYVLDTTDIPDIADLTEGQTKQSVTNQLAQTTTYGVVTEEAMKADAGSAMPLLNWSDDWKAVSNAFPELQFDYTTSVNGQKFVATTEEQSTLANLYTGRTLFQGEMHNHAYTYGRGQDTDTEIKPGDDGKTTLATWKEQLSTYDMDFAASLDHQQIDHIDHEEWDIDKFVYGTEAAATITDLKDQESSGYLHFDMLFKTKEQFVTVLEKYDSIFSYTGTPKSDSTWFTYDNLQFTKAEFANLIKAVYAAGGVVNLPHPMQGPDNERDYSTELEDFIFDVKTDAGKQIIYGFHAITSAYTSGNSRTNYSAWENLLNQGYRIYATSGSDNHADLHANTLTSIYATTCKSGCDGSCENTNCAAYDKGSMLSQISCGDYAAGSVGIQMSIGDTAMGGSRTFADGDRLVIGIGDIHNGYTNASPSHTLRVDVMNEDGVVYSQKVTSGDIIALDVNADSEYYRVVVYNVNTSARIAIGNPIWNDK